jgi:hypothetical protein
MNKYLKPIEMAIGAIVGPWRQRLRWPRLEQDAEHSSRRFQQCAHYMISELQVYPMPDTVRVYQQIMAGYMNNNVARSNGDMVERARRANIAFQKAGNKLIRILDEIENLQSATIS